MSWAGGRGRERERERWQRLLVCRLVVVQYQGQGKAMDEYRSWSVRASVASESLWGHWRREINNGYYPAQQHAQFPKAAAARDPSSSHQCWLKSPAKLWLVHNLTATHTHTHTRSPFLFSFNSVQWEGGCCIQVFHIVADLQRKIWKKKMMMIVSNLFYTAIFLKSTIDL